MKDKKPTNDTELIAALWGMTRHLQSKLHAINAQTWAIRLNEKYNSDPFLSKAMKNIDECTQCIYADEELDVTLLFKKPTESLMRGAARLIQLGWKTGWSDYVGWDERRSDFAEQTATEVRTMLNGDPFGDVKD